MPNFQIIDLFQRYSASPETNTQIAADSVDVADGGGVIFYSGGAKIAIAYLGTGFIVQKME